MDIDPAEVERKQRRSHRQFWLSASIAAIIFFAIGFVPRPWGIVVPITAGIVHSVVSAAVVVVRTRWIFRALVDLVGAVLLGILGALALVQPRGLLELVVLFYLAGFLVLLAFTTRLLERRLNPRLAQAFEEAGRRASPWGHLVMRHIPRLIHTSAGG